MSQLFRFIKIERTNSKKKKKCYVIIAYRSEEKQKRWLEIEEEVAKNTWRHNREASCEALKDVVSILDDHGHDKSPDSLERHTGEWHSKCVRVALHTESEWVSECVRVALYTERVELHTVGEWVSECVRVALYTVGEWVSEWVRECVRVTLHTATQWVTKSTKTTHIYP